MSVITHPSEDADTLSGTPSPGPSTDTRARRNFRSFMVIWAAQLVARVGNGLTAFGLGVYVYQQSGLSTAVSRGTDPCRGHDGCSTRSLTGGHRGDGAGCGAAGRGDSSGEAARPHDC